MIAIACGKCRNLLFGCALVLLKCKAHTSDDLVALRTSSRRSSGLSEAGICFTKISAELKHHWGWHIPEVGRRWNRRWQVSGVTFGLPALTKIEWLD
jgi:hypothetical protein